MSELHETVRALGASNVALEARIAELEGQRSTQEPRRLHRPRLSRRVALLGLTLALLLPGVVLASHQFSDVPNSNPFHDDIGAVAGAGVAAGFGDGTYHPAEPVTRQAMAAFLHRGLGRVAWAIGDAPITSSVSVAAGNVYSPDYVPVRQLTITVPGAFNGFSPQQLVHLQGHVEFTSPMSVSQGCPCTFAARIRDATAGTFSFYQQQTFESISTNSFLHSFDLEATLAALPGARTYELQVWLSYRNSVSNPASYDFGQYSSLSAMTFPFGPNGGNTP
ncbi:MAG: S-layer homology domain-containing protein [Candidatus Limnocylindrales bacterium]